MKGSVKCYRYAKISLKKRMKLVQLVLSAKKTIASAARMLGIKDSTAKLIVKRYRQEGTYFERKDVRQARIQKEIQIIPHNENPENMNSQVLQEISLNQAQLYTYQPAFNLSMFSQSQNIPQYSPYFWWETPFYFILPETRMP